jgi:glycosyltransferase involved in cell wall biosynthesis
MADLVSIIITTKNEEYNIGACLKSINSQTYKNTEVIVVDNNSSDKTKGVAKSHGAYVYDRGPERSTQRNLGASKAKGKYLLFLDADMILSKKVIDEGIHLLGKNTFLKALVIPEKSVGIGFWAACKILERSFYEGIDWIEAARFFRKSVFEILGGYDEKLIGPEDFDLPQRLKARFGNNSIGRIEEYIIHNEGKLSFRRTLQKKYYYANSFPEYSTKIVNADYARKQSDIILRYWVFFKDPGKLFKHPIIGLGMLFLKTAEFLVGAFRLSIRS